MVSFFFVGHKETNSLLDFGSTPRQTRPSINASELIIIMTRSPCYLLVLLAACLQLSSAFVPSNFVQQTSNINYKKSQPIATLKKQSTSSALHISIGSYASSSIGSISTTLSSILPTNPLRRHAKLLLLFLTTITTFIIATKKKSSLLWPGTHVSDSSDNEYPLPPGSFGCPFIGYDLFRYVVSSWYIVCVMISFLCIFAQGSVYI